MTIYPEAPDGETAMEQYIRCYYERTTVEHLHPAVQAAIHDAHAGEHLATPTPNRLPFGEMKGVLPMAFYKNYDEYYLLIWRSNIAGRDDMMSKYPMKDQITIRTPQAKG